MTTFRSGCWNTGTHPDLTFVSVGPDSRVPDRRILEKFSWLQQRRSLIVPPRLALPVSSKPVKQWNFHKANWSHCNALTHKLAKSLLPLIHWMYIWPTMTSAMSSEQQPKILSHTVIKITTYCVGILNARTSTGHFCSHQKEATLTRLPLPCSSGSTNNAEIDGLRQFIQSTFRTLAEKHGVY